MGKIEKNAGSTRWLFCMPYRTFETSRRMLQGSVFVGGRGGGVQYYFADVEMDVLATGTQNDDTSGNSALGLLGGNT